MEDLSYPRGTLWINWNETHVLLGTDPICWATNSILTFLFLSHKFSKALWTCFCWFSRKYILHVCLFQTFFIFSSSEKVSHTWGDGFPWATQSILMVIPLSVTLCSYCWWRDTSGESTEIGRYELMPGRIDWAGYCKNNNLHSTLTSIAAMAGWPTPFVAVHTYSPSLWIRRY